MQRQVEAACGDKVCRDAAYFTPRVLGEARLVCVSGEDRGTGAQLGKGVACQGEVRAHEGLWRELLEERLQALDCAIAGEGASVQIDALVANPGEVFRENAAVVGILIEGSAPSIDKVLHDGQGLSSDTGVVNVDMYNKESVRCDFTEDASVEDALREAVVEKEVIILHLPDPACVAATWHVAGDVEKVASAVRSVRGVVAEVGQPWWNKGVHKTSAILGGRGITVIICAADVLGVLDGALLDCYLGDDAIGGGTDASRVEVVLRRFAALVRDRDPRLARNVVVEGIP